MALPVADRGDQRPPTFPHCTGDLSPAKQPPSQPYTRSNHKPHMWSRSKIQPLGPPAAGGDLPPLTTPFHARDHFLNRQPPTQLQQPHVFALQQSCHCSYSFGCHKRLSSTAASTLDSPRHRPAINDVPAATKHRLIPPCPTFSHCQWCHDHRSHFSSTTSVPPRYLPTAFIA